MLANGIEPRLGKEARSGTDSSCSASTCDGTTYDMKGVPAACRRRGNPHHPVDARARQHSADTTLPERHGRRTTQRAGNQLEKSRTAASFGIGPLMRSCFPARLSRFCPVQGESVAPQVGLEPTTLLLTG